MVIESYVIVKIQPSLLESEIGTYPYLLHAKIA